MTKRYMDWADWAGDHPEQAEADLRAERQKAERWAEHKRLAAQTTPDRDGADSARLYALDRKQQAPTCETEGHEYSFGICLDCDQVDPAFEPDDDMIERDYLRGYDQQAAA